MLDFVIGILLALLLAGLFNMIRNFLKISKMIKKYKDDPNVEGIAIVNGEIKVITKNQKEQFNQQSKNLVTDEICHRQIEKEKAYRIVKDGVEYFFCSWECRQKFLEEQQSGQ